MKRDYKLYLSDIINCINKIDEFVGKMSYNELVTDDKTCSAIIRKLDIIGEAAKNIPKSLRDKYPDLPWKEMSGMRDKIIHDYFGINYKIVWKVIKDRLPEIKQKLMQMLINIEV
jgi:uncharacterized protein with HEPN domain